MPDPATSHRVRIALVLLVALFEILLLNAQWLALFRDGFAAMADSAIEGWRLALWQLDYGDELVKRGLPGSAAALLGWPRTQAGIWWASFLSANAFFAVALWLWRRRIPESGGWPALLLLFLFVVSPATAMHLGYDAGRFDHLVLLATAIAVALVLEAPLRAARWAVPPLIALALATHEAFLVVGLPLVAACTWWRRGEDPGWRSLLFMEGAVAALVMLAILVWGDAGEPTMRAAAARVATLVPGDAQALRSLEVLNEGVGRSISMAAWAWGQAFTLVYMLAVLPLVVSAGWLYFAVVHWPSRSRDERLVALSPFGVAALFGLGLDFYRWIALGLIMLFLALLALRPTPAAIAHPVGTRSGRVALTVLLACTLLGPLGVTGAFPFIDPWLLRLVGVQ